MTCRACGLPTPVCCENPAVRVGLWPADVARLDPEVSLLPAPNLPGGFVAELPRRADGACVMLRADGACGIYAMRPQACRDQDTFFCRSEAARGAV